MVTENSTGTDVVDCACVIHGTGYNWNYVDHLHNMLRRHLAQQVKLHVYTEPTRYVPPHMVKHSLDLWEGIGGVRKSWWYKMQLFNPEHHRGNLLYLDLDVVIVNSIDWAVRASTDYFWTIRDFRYLQKPNYNSMNSSLMYWNVEKFGWIWQEFSAADIAATTRRFQGDQDYLQMVLTQEQKRYYNNEHVQSWRWQVAEGGYNFQARRHCSPGQAAVHDPNASILVFHGNPKPHQVTDPIVTAHWH